MANVYEPTDAQEKAWKDWCTTRPPAVRAVALRFRPWKLYQLKSSGHRVTIRSFGEEKDGTISLTVAVTGEFNAVMFERGVFGIKPDDLVECELPLPGEIVGSANMPIEVVKAIHQVHKKAEKNQQN